MKVSTTSQILALRRILAGIRDFELPAIIAFVDFRKTFNLILRAYDIPEIFIPAIALIYEDQKACKLSPDGEVDWFELFASVHQGDMLTPHLFLIVLDYVLLYRKAIHGKKE